MRNEGHFSYGESLQGPNQRCFPRTELHTGETLLVDSGATQCDNVSKALLLLLTGSEAELHETTFVHGLKVGA